MTVLDHKLRRDLFLSKGMLAAIVAIISVGVGCLVGFFGTYGNLLDARTDYYSRSRMADFWMTLKKAPLLEIDRLSDLKGISELRPRIVFPVVVDLDGVDQPLSGKVLSLPVEYSEAVINQVVLRSGSYFTGRRRDEVLVSEKFAQTRKIAPGDFIHLIMNGQRKKLFVVGTAIASEFMYLTPPGGVVPDPAGYGVFWVKRDFAEDVFGFHGACNDIVGLLTPEAKETPAPTLDELAKRLADYGVFTKTPLKNQFSNLCLSAEMQGLQMQATVMPIIFLGVAALVLNVVMLRLAEQQRTIIGTLKALGVGNSAIFAHFVKFGLVVGILGGIIGGLLGYLLAYGLTSFYQMVFTFPHLGNRFYLHVSLAGLFISVVFSILGTWRGVKKVLQLNPAESMRPPPPPVGGKAIIENWASLWRRLDFRWQMVLRGIFRNKSRSLIGIFAAMMGSAILLMALGMGDSLDYMVVFQFDKVMLCDYQMSFRDDLDHGVLGEAKRLPGVFHVEPHLNVPCHFTNANHTKRGSITGILPNATLTVPCGSDGKRVRIPNTGFLMTKRLANHLNVKPGDTVRFTPIKGLRIPREVPVVNTVDSTFGLAVYANFDYLNKLIREDGAISSILMKARQNPAQERNFMIQCKKYPKLSSLSVMKQQKKQMIDDFITKMKSMTMGMVVFAAVIFFGSILNSALISIAERQREIATFRVLGYFPLEVGSIFLRETMLLNLVGAILGLPLGYYMLYGMAVSFRNDMYSMPCFVANETWFNAMLLALGFILGAYVIIQRTINRLDWSEALKMKE